MDGFKHFEVVLKIKPGDKIELQHYTIFLFLFVLSLLQCLMLKIAKSV